MGLMDGDEQTAVASHTDASTSASTSSGSSSSGSQSSASEPRWKGRRIKRFRLVDELGKGAMGRVFLAEDTVLKRHVALKLLPARHRDGRVNHRSEKLIREARSAATLDHPNSVTIHEIDENSGVHYIAMELVEGGDLERLVRMTGPMDVERACQMIAEAAEALQHAHSRGIIHRDIKPANLLLTRSGRCKVCDFGLAYFGDAIDIENRGKCVGTPHFIAPEIARGQGATERSDIYSLGCTLFFLLAGRTPYNGTSAQELLRQHIIEPLPDLRAIRSDVPEKLIQAIEQATNKDPAIRFDSAERFGKIVRTFTIPAGNGFGSHGVAASVGGSAGTGPSAPALEPVSIGASQQIEPIEVPFASAVQAPVSPVQKAIAFVKRLPKPALYGGAAAAVLVTGAGIWLVANGSSEPAGSLASAKPASAIIAPPSNLPTFAGPDAALNGSLEKQDPNGNVIGWFVHDRFKPFVQIVNEDGNHFMRLTNGDPAKTVFVDHKINIDPTWKAVTVSARMRAINFKPGKLPSHDARVAFAFRDDQDKRVGSWPPVPSVRSDSPWTERVVTADVPPGASSMYIQLAIFNATGTADFDDIHIIPQQTK